MRETDLPSPAGREIHGVTGSESRSQAQPPHRGARSLGAAREEAVRILTRYGADPSSGPETGSAMERFFSVFHRRFDRLFGKGGYRSLIEQAHHHAMKSHPALEHWPVLGEGNPFFGVLREGVLRDDPAEVWAGAVALTAHFLQLVERLARRGEMDGLVEADTWDRTGKGGGASVDSRPVEEGWEGVRSRRAWRILIVDRDVATCEAMARSLEEAPDFLVVNCAYTIEEVQTRVGAEEVDFVVASGHLPAKEVLRLCGWLQETASERVPQVVISGLPEDYGLILRFLEAGAAAVALEDFSLEGLRLNIRLLARGEAILPLRLQHLMSRRLNELAGLVRDRGLDLEALSDLSPREAEVLDLMEEGLTNRQIARRFFITEGTVKGHVHQILKKLKVRGREEAAKVLRLGRGRTQW